MALLQPLNGALSRGALRRGPLTPPKAVAGTMIDIDTASPAMAMSGLGLTTNITALRTAGIRPLLLSVLLLACLS